LIILIIHILVSYDQNIDYFYVKDGSNYPCQGSTSVLCLHYRPETVHCSTKDAYTSEITFLALVPWLTIVLIGNTEYVLSRDKRVAEIDYQLKCAIFSTACSIVYKYCTRPIRRHLYSGIFKDPLDMKHKIFKKKDWIYKCYVSFLKLEYFFKNCKT